MTTSGSTSFDLNLTELVEEAFERAGAELRSGYDLRTARRSLNLLLLEWQNRGLNLWTVEQGTLPLVTGVAIYDLPQDTVDLIEHVLRTDDGTSNQTDLALSRISVSTYASIPNKLSTGRPNRVYINRKSGAIDSTGVIQYPQLTVWPVPPDDSYTIIYWRMRRMEDAQYGTGTQDVPSRFLPALVAGLAWQLSMKLPEGANRIDMLKMAYEEQWGMAADEDRDRSSFFISPRLCP